MLKMKIDDIFDLREENTNKYGISKEYDRQKLDDVKFRKSIKEKTFAESETINDFYTGELLYKSHNSAMDKFGKKGYSKHAAETDHTVPLRYLHQKHKDSLFLTDEELKKIANSEINLEEISKRQNAIKGCGTNLELVLNPDLDYTAEQRLKLLANQIKAECGIEIKIRLTQAKNIGNEFKNGACKAFVASAIPLAVFGINKIFEVAEGRKTLDEATEDVKNLGITIGITGGFKNVLTSGLNQIANKSSFEIINKFAQCNQIGNILIMSSFITNSTIRYINREINEIEFFEEIGSNSLDFAIGLLSTRLLGGVLTGTIAPIISSFVISSVCSQIYSAFNQIQLHKKNEMEIYILCKAASSEI